MDIPFCGYISYKNILILFKKSHYVLLTEFNNLEIKYIEKEYKTTISIEDYVENDQLIWIIRINGPEKNITNTIKGIEDILNHFNIWINSENQEISRIDPVVIKKIIKYYKNLPDYVSLYCSKTILLISGKNKILVDKFEIDINNSVLKFQPKMIFFWTKLPDFFDILYDIEPLCNPNTGFKSIVSKNHYNTLMSHVLIMAEKPFIDQIWKSAKTILDKNIKQKNSTSKKNKLIKNFKKQNCNANIYIDKKNTLETSINNVQINDIIDNYMYLDLQTNSNTNRKKKVIKDLRVINPNYVQIPISKYERNDSILSSSI